MQLLKQGVEMDKKLQKELFKKYPKIFRQKDLSMKETCMCLGIETGDGWYNLIDNLCSFLQFNIDNNNYPQIEAVQVKEKYGTLRFYCNGGNDSQEGTISFAEYLSGFICERCGSTDNVNQTEGWIVTLCEKCMKKRLEERG
jgi:hypothetical protein